MRLKIEGEPTLQGSVCLGAYALSLVSAEMYSLLLETYIKDTAEKRHLFRAIETIPCIAKKAAWALKWISRCLIFIWSA